MGKLNIAHHKSYHPYRRDNIERVRRDEEEAALKEAEQEGRIVLADAEARLTLLRERVGIGGNRKEKERADAVEGPGTSSSASGGSGIGSGKHINLFEDLEQQAMITAVRATKKTASSEVEKGVPLAPNTKDLNPWYSGKSKDHSASADDDQDERRRRDLRSKSRNDPLTSITRQLASRNSTPRLPLPSTDSRSRQHRSSRHSDQPPSSSGLPPQPKALDPTTARLNRECSERERALALIRRKKREMLGSETPSTVHGGVQEGYGDVYNRRAVEEAHAHKDRRRRRDW